MAPHADHTLILALREGDFSVLNGVYADNASTITSWITKNSGSLADAQDVFQEGIIALHQKANDPDFVLTCPIGALLFRICQNKWLYTLRKKKRSVEVRDALPTAYSSEGNVHDLLEAVEEEGIRQRKMKAAFAELSELCQRLLRLLAKGLPAATIAAELGMAEANTVYRRRHACGSRWRKLYEGL
ncbi:RNA polymerase sigma factor [Neolewinella persica]|uniref:RNA polymerase sigma factor n=1 Tax=Neolewinella persica TaxID=70998 RepID=UPI0003642AAF|nr:sigma-70 family RNA polymerase sigma factor [Neolewinella persica]